MPQARGWVEESLARLLKIAKFFHIATRVRVPGRSKAQVVFLQNLFIETRTPWQPEHGKIIRHAEKLSPQEQWATAFGLVTLKPPFCKSSLKSNSDPLTNNALFGSITTFT